MLHDFCQLFLELYGERHSTHNMHLLPYLCKYVRLWGPLSMHSTFSFENRNGHLKYLFHGKHNVVNQILFNMDVSLTLQMLYPHLEQMDILDYIASLRHLLQGQKMAYLASLTHYV